MFLYTLIISFITFIGSMYFAIETYKEVKSKAFMFWFIAIVFSLFMHFLSLTLLLGGN